MPNIVTYESKSGITPSDKGINAAADAARLYAQVGNQVGRDISRGLHDIGDAVEKHQAIMETSELYKTGTELEFNLQKLYEEESSRPENRGDPTFGDRFLAEKVNPLLDQWGEGASTDHGKQLATTLKASIRNKVFNHVAAGQAEMDAAHVDDNLSQQMNLEAAGLITDPSETNLRATLGRVENTIQGVTAIIPDVGMREQSATYNLRKYRDAMVVARYQGVAESIKNQIAETGGETSPALEQLNKDIKAQLGFQYISPEQQTAVSKLGEQAVSQGQELYRSRQATIKSQVVEEGNAAFAQIHSALTARIAKGEQPTPDEITAIQQFSSTYGRYLPDKAASLDTYMTHGLDRAQQNVVQPFNQQVRDNIQTGFALPKGDPRRPTQASLIQNLSHGEITPDDFKEYNGILDLLDHPEKDPAFKAAWDNFVRWRDAQAAGIGGEGQPGTAAARGRFINDVTNNFMARGKAMGDWDRAYDRVTNIKIPGNFANPTILDVYRKAAEREDAGAWLNSRWPQWNPNTNTLTWPSGTGGGRPSIGGDVPPPPPGFAPAQTPAADLKKADEIIWGKQ